MDILKKAAKSHRNARLNSDAEEDEEDNGACASRVGSLEEAVGHPEQTVHNEESLQCLASCLP